jgi:hypothetical protein
VNWVTDKKFLVGLAIGTFLMPRILKFAQAQMGSLRAAATPQG